MPATNLTIIKGKTFQRTLRWAVAPFIYKPITAITKAAPAVVTCAAHGIPPGWRTAITAVKGMTEINALDCNAVEEADYHKAGFVDANTISLDMSSACFTAYTSGGYLQYWSPVDMAGYTARMSIKAKVGGVELFRLDTTNGRITIDNVNKKIDLLISATDTAALSFSKGLYDLEMVSPGGVVSLLICGAIAVTEEITTT